MNDFSRKSDGKSNAYRAFIATRPADGWLGDECRRLDEAHKARVNGADIGRNLILARCYVVHVHICPIENDRWAQFFREWREPSASYRPYSFHAVAYEADKETTRGSYRKVFDVTGDWRTWSSASTCLSSRIGFSGSGLVRRIMEKALLQCRLGRRLEQSPLPEGHAGAAGQVQGSDISSKDGQQKDRCDPLGVATGHRIRYDGPAQDGSIHFSILRETITKRVQGEQQHTHDKPLVVFEPSSVGILRGSELSFDGSDLLSKVFGEANEPETELPVFDLETF